MLPKTNLPWWRHDRPWGFRFSVMDAIFFIGGIMATKILWPMIGLFALFIPYLLAHFFLFCNTFRIGGERTLIWIFMFVLNTYFWIKTQDFAVFFGIQVATTMLLIVQCVLGKNYHGLACASINPTRFREGAMTEGAFTRRVLLACRLPKPLIEILVGRRLDEFES